jgi:hypothetical protein
MLPVRQLSQKSEQNASYAQVGMRRLTWHEAWPARGVTGKIHSQTTGEKALDLSEKCKKKVKFCEEGEGDITY